MTLTDNTVQNVVIHWWETVGYQELHKQLKFIRQTRGTILRCDHTYKCVNSLGVTADKRWVFFCSCTLTDIKQLSLKASLFVVMDEGGAVHWFNIVPCDSREYMRTAFRDIWDTPSRQVITQAVYTDNVRTDTNTLQDTFMTVSSHEGLPPVLVLQDIWHAQQRIFSAMSFAHADYKTAKKEFKTITAKLITPNGYPLKQDLIDAINVWKNKWSLSSNAQKLNSMEQIHFLGKYKHKTQFTVLVLTGAKLNKEKAPKSLLKKINQGSDPVLGTRALHAVENILQEPVLSGLWRIREVQGHSQGTSPVENLNSRFSLEKPKRASGTTYDTTLLFVSSVIYKSNRRYE